jgi:thiol:disulfide interchange protein DsbD
VGTTPAAGTMPASGMAVGAGTTPAAGMAAPARPRGPTLQVFGLALTYVLGMAIMYSALGLVAALTGGLFGGFLQNPVVLLGIGVLMIALSLSMFGLYEFQPPAWLLERAGGTTGTSVLGVFLSGLVVGVFAAPCVGPPVVALLAVVGARGDPWFGFATFFTLAMGLGFPYLVLGTFSGLISSLPRSGDWMEWVKKVFGVILVAVGLFYALLAFAPKQAALVVPAALVLGGVYLGFFEKSGAKKPGFAWLKRVAGTGAVIAGVVMWSGMQAKGIEFRAATEADLDAALAAGRPVMIDFSADWCVPCHELDNFTFTDRRVIAAARDFVAFKVDLTRYDSPEAERWRRRYEITGVPTIVFLGRGGEVRGARVEGFLPAGPFLERMELAQATAEPAAAN